MHLTPQHISRKSQPVVNFMFGCVSSVWTCYQCLDVFPVFGRVSSVWTCFQCLDVFPVFVNVSSVWRCYLQCLEVLPLVFGGASSKKIRCSNIAGSNSKGALSPNPPRLAAGYSPLCSLWSHTYGSARVAPSTPQLYALSPSKIGYVRAQYHLQTLKWNQLHLHTITMTHLVTPLNTKQYFVYYLISKH